MSGDNIVFAKAATRLIPFMVLLYIANFLDRVNVGFAALTMNRDLGIGAEAFGLAGGIFFLGYFLFEVPSNVILEKVGARLWIFRIMLTWGIVSIATAFVRGIDSLLVLRFLLGVAEAGFFPGVIFYFGLWFPGSVRARFVALFLGSIALANVIGAPLSAFILGMEGTARLHGWQWLFILEGLPSCLLAFAVLLWLPDGPADATWLDEGEKAAIAARLGAEPPHTHQALLPMLRDPRVWLLALPDFCIVLPLYGLGLWLPQIVQAMGYSNVQTGLVVAILYGVGVTVAILWSASSDRMDERIHHIAIAACVGAGGMIAAAFTIGTPMALAAFAVAGAGIYAAISVFWALPSGFLGRSAAAGGIALINALANLGGFCGPYLMGWLKHATGSYAVGIAVLGVSLVVTAISILALGRTLNFGRRAHVFDKFAPPM